MLQSGFWLHGRSIFCAVSTYRNPGSGKYDREHIFLAGLKRVIPPLAAPARPEMDRRQEGPKFIDRGLLLLRQGALPGGYPALFDDLVGASQCQSASRDLF